MTIRFFAQGLPKGQPRPKAFSRGGHARVYDPGTAEGWKGQVALAARPHLPARPLTGPLKLVLRFYFPRPKSHFTTKGLRDTAPRYHTSKPDFDNAAKAVSDALTELRMWGDDALVAVCVVEKWYATNETGCSIEISPLL